MQCYNAATKITGPRTSLHTPKYFDSDAFSRGEVMLLGLFALGQTMIVSLLLYLNVVPTS